MRHYPSGRAAGTFNSKVMRRDVARTWPVMPVMRATLALDFMSAAPIAPIGLVSFLFLAEDSSLDAMVAGWLVGCRGLADGSGCARGLSKPARDFWRSKHDTHVCNAAELQKQASWCPQWGHPRVFTRAAAAAAPHNAIPLFPRPWIGSVVWAGSYLRGVTARVGGERSPQTPSKKNTPASELRRQL